MARITIVIKYLLKDRPSSMTSYPGPWRKNSDMRNVKIVQSNIE